MMLAQKFYHMMQVERQQWLKPAELKRLQDAKLRAMVRHAYANVPFYRRAWKAAGVRPEDVRTADDLRKLPVVTRTDAKKNHREMLSRDSANRRQCMRHTSGSSGKMLVIPVEEGSMEFRQALIFRSGRVAGYRPWKRTAVIYPESPMIRFYERGRKVFVPSSSFAGVPVSAPFVAISSQTGPPSFANVSVWPALGSVAAPARLARRRPSRWQRAR